MKSFLNNDKLESFIAPKITDLITLPDKNGKSDVYTGVNIHGRYCYFEIIVSPTTLTTSVQRYHRFCLSSSTNIDTSTLHPIIAALCTRHKIICEWCGIIGHKADTCIIRGPKFLPPSLRRNMNQFNAIHFDGPTDRPRECNSQPPVAHFKSSIYSPKIIPVVSSIMSRLNHHAIYNGDVWVSHFIFSCWI